MSVPKALEAFIADAPNLVGDAMQPHCFGPGSGFHQAVAVAKEGTEIAAILVAATNANVPPNCKGRWDLLVELARIRLTPKEPGVVDSAIKAIDTYEEPLGGSTWDAPATLISGVEKYGARLRADSWTRGTFAAFDSIRKSDPTVFGEDTPPVVEQTPLVLAPSGFGKAIVLDLCVERLPGPSELVQPDWWRIGLIDFPSISESFLLGVQQSLAGRAGNHRLRWWLERREFTNDGKKSYDDWPYALNGHSANAAAACAAYALSQRQSAEDQLLDPTASVSAKLVGSASDVENQLLGTVMNEDVEAKIIAARKYGLLNLFFADGQDGIKDRHKKDELVATLRTFGEAYDSLLYFSRGIREHQQNVVAEWNRRWRTE